MSHKDNVDVRNTGDGGWFYAEHELFSVFVPLIGPDGAMVYMAMCRLVPLAAVDPDRPVTVRSCSEACGVSKSTTQRKMAEIAALGMVEETRRGSRRPSTYRLVSLRKLALLGMEELKSRIGVPLGDTERGSSRLDAAPDGADAATHKAHGGRALYSLTQTEDRSGAQATRHLGGNGVPPRDTKRPPVETRLVDLLVSQKKALVSQKEASVSQKGGSLFKEEKEEDKYSPLPLSQAKGELLGSRGREILPRGSRPGGMLRNVAAGSDAKPEPKGKSQKPSPEAKAGAGIGGELGRSRAVERVQRECGLSAPRIAAVIAAAMRLEADKTDAPPDWDEIGERMAASYARYLAMQHLLAYKPGARKFFAEGLWADERKWPWDERRMSENRRL